MKRYFIDTFHLIALFDPKDDAYDLAHAFLEARFTGVTTGWVLAEFANTFSTRDDREGVAAIIDGLLHDPDTVVIPFTNEWFDRGLTLYRSRPDKEWSLTDCISFLVMQDSGLTEALTGDHHFEQAGFVALLK